MEGLKGLATSDVVFLDQPSMALFLIAFLVVWSVFWKGKALWHAARNSQKYWFVALLVINTLGILEIVYLSFFQKTKKN